MITDTLFKGRKMDGLRCLIGRIQKRQTIIRSTGPYGPLLIRGYGSYLLYRNYFGCIACRKKGKVIKSPVVEAYTTSICSYPYPSLFILPDREYIIVTERQRIFLSDSICVIVESSGLITNNPCPYVPTQIRLNWSARIVKTVRFSGSF